MTEEDHALLKALTDARDTFCVNLVRNQLTRDDHIEMALMFLDMADRMLRRLIETLTTADGTTTCPGAGPSR